MAVCLNLSVSKREVRLGCRSRCALDCHQHLLLFFASSSQFHSSGLLISPHPYNSSAKPLFSYLLFLLMLSYPLTSTLSISLMAQ